MLQRFLNYQWPGNARELKSAIDRMALLYDGPVLREGWWDVPLSPPDNVATAVVTTGLPAIGFSGREKKMEMARHMLVESGNNFTLVAARLGINPTTLWRWRKTGKL